MEVPAVRPPEGRQDTKEGAACAAPSRKFCGVRLLGLETIVGGSAQSVEEVLNVLGGVGLGVREVVLHHVVGIQTEFGRFLGLLGVVDHQELIALIFLGDVDALGAQSKLDPQLGGVLDASHP